jgi:glycogen operon protein
VLALRERQKRNLVATLFLSLGVPLLLAGDEFGHSQRGNNNAYCQDNEISWIDWNGRTAGDAAFETFVKTVLRLRREHPAFQYDAFFTGRPRPGSDRKDIAWYTPAGAEMSGDDWQREGRAIGVFFGDRPLFAVLFNAGDHDVTFTLPESAAVQWRLLLDTAHDTVAEPPGEPVTTYDVTARSIAVFNGSDA